MQFHSPLGLLALVLSPLALAQTEDEFEPYREIPGTREFSGVLCARPVQIADARARGLDQAAAERLYAEAIAQLEGLSIEEVVVATDEYLITLAPGVRENDLAKALMKSGAFQYVEPDWICYPVGCPNDAEFSQQWQHSNMESCAGWDVETGDPGIVVAICDTGLQVGHPDLALHRQEGYHAPSQTWESAGGDITAVHSHGTMTTGCAAANGDNGIGVAGVGWNLGHRMMRVTDDSGGGASLSNLTNAARTAIEAGDRVANVSYSGVASSSVESTGAYIRTLGGLLTWSGGNSSENHAFSRDDSVIIVGASDSSDNRTSWSAYGAGIDFLAPGSGVRTTTTGSGYASVSGTSFSAPITAGLIGLIWSANPGLTPVEVETILRDTCDDLGTPGVDDDSGYGRINVRRALELAAQAISITLQSAAPTTLDPAGGETIDFIVAAGSGTPQAGTGQFWINSGASWSLGTLVQTSPNHYTATFPPVPCGANLSYYFAASDTTGQQFYEPAEAPTTVFTAVAQITVAVSDDLMEVSTGWTMGAAGDSATTGVWTHGNPLGTAAQPEDDHTPSGTMCFFTGQGSGGSVGENDVDGGTTTLISPSHDLSGTTDPTISYWRWYNNQAGSAPNADVFVVDISDDGGATWTNVETVGPTGDTGGGWVLHSFQASALVSLTNAVRLRFVASDLGSGSIVEAAVDDLSIYDTACSSCGISFYCPAVSNSTGTNGKIGFAGSSSIALNDLVLTATDLPANQFGTFIQGLDSTVVVVGAGVLCIGTTQLGFIHRLGIQNSGALGSVSLSFDNTSPSLPSVQVDAGETWYFQYWFRDPAGWAPGYNFTDALTITFCP